METTREAHQARMKAHLDEWTARLDVLEAKVAQADAGAKIELHKAADELRKLHASGKKQLGQLVSASADAWMEAKRGLDDGWTKVSSAAEAIWKKVS